MSGVAEIATGIARQFESVEGLRCFDHMPGTVNPPALCVYLDIMKPSTMGRGWLELQFSAYLFTSTAVARVGQQDLHAVISPNAAWTAFGDNNDLDLTDGTTATLQEYRGLSIEEFAAYPYYGGVFEIRVTTPGV